MLSQKNQADDIGTLLQISQVCAMLVSQVLKSQKTYGVDITIVGW